ncbi:MAG: RES family NAD+ phosphorylase [Lapillicoccus sp.]
MVTPGKVPRAPEGPLSRRAADLHRFRRTTPLWRVHATAGPHVVPWDELRQWGPTTSRWDPQPPPPGPSTLGVAYAALDVSTALAEVFPQTRVVDTRSLVPCLTAWRPTRDLRLLDLTDTWPIRAGAAHALTSAPRAVCRAWARAIVDTWPELDGLWSLSTMTGAPTVTLFTAAADAFPHRPAFSRTLTTPGLRLTLDDAARRIGYRIR